MWEFEQLGGSEVLLTLLFTPLISVSDDSESAELAPPLNELPPIQATPAGLSPRRPLGGTEATGTPWFS